MNEWSISFKQPTCLLGNYQIGKQISYDCTTLYELYEAEHIKLVNQITVRQEDIIILYSAFDYFAVKKDGTSPNDKEFADLLVSMNLTHRAEVSNYMVNNFRVDLYFDQLLHSDMLNFGRRLRKVK